MSSLTEAYSMAALPARYRTDWHEPFEEAVRSWLVRVMTVLDVGLRKESCGGRR
jgi:hypothetical protein